MKQYFLFLTSLFLIFFGAISFWCNRHADYDLVAMQVANILLALLSVFSYFMLRKNMKVGRPRAFVNGVYGSTLLRLMLCMGSIFIYLFANKGNIHQPTIFVMMGMYVVYTAFETISLSKISKQNK
ncbi:MAG: hypothetical protein IT256_05335 [Chitinophagaceae bacterium]|nr:hypothetical protein [Chitinophagaceae bacterium]